MIMHISYERLRAAALVAVMGGISLSGCGGGGSTGAASVPAPQTPAANSKTNATATIFIPAKTTSAHARHAQWISPSTMAIDFSSFVNGVSVAYTFAALTLTSPNCHAVPGGTSCNVAFAVVAGPQQMSVTIYDNINAYQSSALATTTQTINVAPGATSPNFSFTLNGIVAQFAPPPTFTGFTNFTAGTPGAQSVTVTAQDADGNNIPGNWDVPSIPNASDDSTHQLTLSPAFFNPAPSTTVNVNYSGGLFTASTFVMNACSPYFQQFGGLCPGAQLVPVDVQSQSLYVANGAGGSILAFQPLANGNLVPERVIPANVVKPGSKALYGGGGNPAYLATGGGYVFWSEPTTNATVQAQPGAGISSPVSLQYLMCDGYAGNQLVHPTGVTGFPIHPLVVNNGNAILGVNMCGGHVPFTSISGPATLLSNATAIWYDAASNGIYVINNNGTQILEFAATASGNAAPIASISGPSSGLNGASGIAVSNVVIVTNSGNNSITEYAPGLGSATPTATIAGSATGLAGPAGVTYDSTGAIYVANKLSNQITVYPAGGGSGNIAPIRTISGPSTMLNGPVGVAIRP